ncbi:MAG: hypothetical protein ACR2L2_07190 [Acidobacteriota bacterium]
MLRFVVFSLVLALFPQLTAHTISGYITDGLTGKPLSGRVTTNDDVTVTANSDGYYKIEGVRAGRKILRAWRFNYSFVLRDVAVGAVNTQEDFVLYPGASVSGVVADSGGNPVPERQLRIAYKDQDLGNLINRFGIFASWMFGETKADAIGRFTLANVQPNTPLVIEVCKGPVVTSSYDIQLKPGQTVQDLVLMRGDNPPSLKVRVLGEDGRPIPRAHLQLARHVPTSPGYSRSQDLSRAQFQSSSEGGQAIFDAVHQGTHKVTVRHPEYQPHSTDIVVTSGTPGHEVLVVLIKR